MKQNRKPLKQQRQEGSTVVQPPDGNSLQQLCYMQIIQLPKERGKGGLGNRLGIA